MDSAPFLRFIIAGHLHRNFILTPSGSACLDLPGGNLIYAAVGLRLWDSHIGLIGRVGEDYPQEWLAQMGQQGLDTRGVKILPASLDHRRFAAYLDQEDHTSSNPVAHFSRLGLPFPKALLGYTDPVVQMDSRTQPTSFTVRLSDFPSDYLDATAAHLAPMDYLSHTLLPPALRQGHVTTITLDPSAGYMNPTFWDDIPVVLRGITAFLPNEDKMLSLFQGRTEKLWDMADELAAMGCEIIVIKRGLRGQIVYDHARHARYIIPAYPARVVDPTGAGDAFCGGFLAGLRSSYDPLEAALYGNVAASLVIEGSGPYYALDAMPGLAEARLQALRDMVRKV